MSYVLLILNIFNVLSILKIFIIFSGQKEKFSEELWTQFTSVKYPHECLGTNMLGIVAKFRF